MDQQNNAPRLIRHLSPLAVWALSFGCSVGWGAFVMPGSYFLPNAGPLGTVIGMAAGAAIMLIFGFNYSFLINRYPDSGGTYSYSKQLFGYDHGLLSAWFMGLVYLAITWANATAIPLIFRNVSENDVLQFGRLYKIAGYDVYLGEILISVAALIVFGLVCLRGIRLTAVVQTVFALLLMGGVVYLFIAVFTSSGTDAANTFDPAFSAESSPLIGILLVVSMAPWAFAGFESVSHTSEEFRFPHKKVLRILVISLAASAAAYILLSVIAASVWPADMPVFFAIRNATGKAGLVILGITAAAGIITGLVGNITAASRLMYSMSRDEMMPRRIGALNRYGAPKYAILFLVAISLPIPFFGRAAIGWIVDVNTIGVAIAYAYTSAAAFKLARSEGRRGVQAVSVLGMAVSVFFLFYFLIPKLTTSLAAESYFMLLLWAVLGFVVFFLLFRRDRQHRMGNSIVIWL
ncbi:MAG: APC family permease, partial [Clostridia bacterium]|nr:APC family permease [Clostridia bacterium]